VDVLVVEAQRLRDLRRQERQAQSGACSSTS
jgi:hypothetical protein